MNYIAIFLALLLDAGAFIWDPEARKASEFKYPSGQPMSVRDARDAGLLSDEM